MPIAPVIGLPSVFMLHYVLNTGQDSRPELADVGRLARRLVNRAVQAARGQDQPLRRLLLDYLGPDAPSWPTLSATWPAYEHVNVQVGLDAWLAGAPGDAGPRQHEVFGITGIGYLRQLEIVGIGDSPWTSSSPAITSSPASCSAASSRPAHAPGRPARAITGRGQAVAAGTTAGLRWTLQVLVGRSPVVAGPSGSRAAADRQRLHLRASHADRERVIEVLKVAFVQGRLTKDELDARAARAFAAKTYADLAGLTADLPAGRVKASPPSAKANVKAAVALTITAILIPVVLVAAGFLTSSAGLVKMAFLMAVLDVMALLVAGAQVLDSRYRKRSGGR
jgi:hypothetical protein